jgi:Uma2 family endonuclease
MSAILPKTPTLPAARPNWPTMYDLPFEEVGEPAMPDDFHVQQGNLLAETFRPPAFWPDRCYSAVDMYLYYDRKHTGWHKRPDWFGVLGVPNQYAGHDLRYSYVTWDEGQAPLIVVELLSDSTEDEDLGRTSRTARKPPTKWEVYEQILQVPYYAVFSRNYTELRFFRLTDGRYVEDLEHQGRVWLPEAELGLGVWDGAYNMRTDLLWLRFYDAEGNWLPTYEEQADQHRQRAEQERWRAEQERRRAEQARQQADQEQRRADQEQRRANQEQRRADQEQLRAEQEQLRAEQAEQRAARLAELLRQLGHDPKQL